MLASWTKRQFRGHRALAVEFSWLVVAHVAMLAGGLFTIKILSNLLNKQQFGVYALLFSAASLIVSWLYSPLGQIDMRYLALSRQEGWSERFRRDQARMLGIAAGVSVLAVVPAAIVLARYTSGFLLTFAVLTALTLAMGAQTSQQFLLMAFRLRREASIAQMVGAASRPLLAFLALWLFQPDARAAVLGLAVGFAILALVQARSLRAPWKTLPAQDKLPPQAPEHSLPPAGLGNYLSYGAFYALVGLIMAVILYADRWLLSWFGTLEQVAIYGALVQLALAPVGFAHSVIIRLAAPIYFEAGDLNPLVEARQFGGLLGSWAIACVVLLTVTWLFAEPIVQLVTNRSFAAYAHILPWLVAGLMLERTSQVFELRGALALKTSAYVPARLLYVALVMLLEFLFLRNFGFETMAYGLVIAGIVGVACIYVINRRHY